MPLGHAGKEVCPIVVETLQQSWYWTVLGAGPLVRTGSSAGGTPAGI
jgi:hypothetical protein